MAEVADQIRRMRVSPIFKSDVNFCDGDEDADAREIAKRREDFVLEPSRHALAVSALGCGFKHFESSGSILEIGLAKFPECRHEDLLIDGCQAEFLES